MRKLLLLAPLLLFACETEPAPDAYPDQTGVDTTAVLPAENLDPLPETHDCRIEGVGSETEEFWVRPAQVLVGLVYGETDNGGLSTQLRAMDTRSCTEINRIQLPAPDAESVYYLAEPQYNSSNRLVGIFADQDIYVYDAEQNRLSPKINPQFRTPRMMNDPETGAIQKLIVLEDYLLGYAADQGTFVVSIDAAGGPKNLLPLAEYAVPNTNQYHAVFALPQGENRQQLLLPEWDEATFELDLHPVFEQPVVLLDNAVESARDNRHFVAYRALPDGGREAVALDLAAHMRVELPANVANQSVGSILQYLRRNAPAQ